MEEWLKCFVRVRNSRNVIFPWFGDATCSPRVELSNVQFWWSLLSITIVTESMDRGGVKCVKFNYWKLPLRSLLASMEAIIYTTDLADSVSVCIDVILLVEASSICRQRSFYKSELSTIDLSEK